MKKSFILVSLWFLMIFSACGASEDLTTTPEPVPMETEKIIENSTSETDGQGSHETTIPTPNETKYTADNSIIQQVVNATASAENFTSSFDEETQTVTHVYHFDSSFDSIKLVSEIMPDSYADWVSQIQAIAEMSYSALISNGITTVQTYLNVVDEADNVFLTYHNGEKTIDLIASSDHSQSTSTPATIPETIVYTGSGDSVIEVEIASSDDIYVLHVIGNANGNHFAVRGYDASGNSTELFVNTINPYDGYTFDPSCSTSLLEISSTGDWTIELVSIYNMQTISSGQTISGTGDSIIMVGDYGTTATISGNQSANHFAVKTYGTQSNELLVNTVDPYSVTVMLNGDPVILQVNSEGEWEITFN